MSRITDGRATWTCPSCGTGWPEKPLVDGTIGCPECGSIAATGVDPVRALAGWAAEDAEGRVMTIVEDPSFADWVPMVLSRLSAAEQERDELKAAYDFDVHVPIAELRELLAAAEARAEAAEQALRTIAESKAYDHSKDGPGFEGSTPYEWTRRVARAALAPEQSSGAIHEYDENLDLRSWWMRQQ